MYVNSDDSRGRAIIWSAWLALLLIAGAPRATCAAVEANDALQIQSRSEQLYSAAAEGKWVDAYALFAPDDKRDTPLDRFIVLFKNNRPFRCLAVRVRAIEDDSPIPAAGQYWHRMVEVKLRFKVEYPDGHRATIRHYSDLWVQAGGEWFFAGTRNGPFN